MSKVTQRTAAGTGQDHRGRNRRSMRLSAILASLLLVSVAAKLIVVTPEEFGAVGNGIANDWWPIVHALQACTNAVYSSPASSPNSCKIVFTQTYLSGPLALNSSNTTLQLNTGATLRMLPRKAYLAACPTGGCPLVSTPAIGQGPEPCRNIHPNPHLPQESYTVCLSNITITGGGIIDGNSDWNPNSWWLCARLQLPTCGRRPELLLFQYVERLTVSELRCTDPPTGFMRLHGNVHARVSGLELHAPYLTRNTDGINVYGGFDTLLENSVVDNGDDCVSIVPTGEWIDAGNFCFLDPGNVLCSGGHAIVRNVTCNGGHGLSIGGIRHGTVSNVTFENITATGGQKGSTQGEEAGGGCRIKSRPNSTGTVHAIRYKNMVFKDVYWPLQLLGKYCPFPCTQKDGNTSTFFTNISFENIQGSSSQHSWLSNATSTTVAQFKCTTVTPCQNITMKEVVLTDKAGHPGLLECENVEDVRIDAGSSPNACSGQR